MKFWPKAVFAALVLLAALSAQAADPCRDALDDPDLHNDPARAIIRLEACLDYPLAGARERAMARLERGFAFAASGREDKALADYTAVIRLFPDYAPAYGYRGSLLMSQFKPNLALADFNRALQLDPTDSGSLWNRSLAFELLGDLKAALRDAEAYLRLVPGDRQARARLKKLKAGK